MKTPSSFRILLPVFLLCSLLFLVACGAPPGNPEDGKKWFMMHNCYSCHGINGYGGRAPKIAGLDMSFGSFLRKLRKADASIMPQFPESKLPKQDAADIFAYLKGI